MSRERCGYQISATKTCRNYPKPGEDRCWQHIDAPSKGKAGKARLRNSSAAPAAPLVTPIGRRQPQSPPQRPSRHGPQGDIADDEPALQWSADRVRAHTSGTSDGITAYQTMKNYHGIAALRRMTQEGNLPHGAKAVFAGGTCLALGHRLVERYSEDIDVVIVGCSDLGADQRDEVLNALEVLASDHGRLPSLGARRSSGKFANLELGYQRTIEPEDTKSLGIKIDAGFADTLPERDLTTVSVETYSSLRGDRPFATLYDDLVIPEVVAVKPRVTMAKKLIALHQRAVAGNRKSLAGRARDVANIGALANHDPTLHSLREQGSTVADIDMRQAERAKGIDPNTPAGKRLCVRRPPGGFADSPVWKTGDPMNKALRDGYQGLGRLIYDKSKKPKFEDVVARVHEIRDLL